MVFYDLGGILHAVSCRRACARAKLAVLRTHGGIFLMAGSEVLLAGRESCYGLHVLVALYDNPLVEEAVLLHDDLLAGTG